MRSFYTSPIGIIKITGNDNSISSLYFIDKVVIANEETNPYLNSCIIQLEEYFKGERKVFDLRLDP